ncbi:hypothetical protein [Kibdelosporangium phytohabitans]|uniref:Uncharacterized protein n=1 Tax=Kibdelosporangium phytohabitans TaxID=860235 RepID=A0A0N9I342_9PSEU|nr:hypothetical protein [Kibdelosporangium phytohabitans]ALG12193.1 hypothetical protein AOZ06_39815 [Kibdelosporangium phytohabitans]MBE1463723.1 hypothetical protein [Kibdelosporangium phytohabitans]
MSRTTLPSHGDEFEISCAAPDAEIDLRAKPLKVTFTGSCTARAEAGSGDTTASATLKLLSVTLTAELPDAGGAEDGGAIDMRLDDAEGHILLTEDSSGLDLSLTFRLAAVVRQPGGTMELRADKPMELRTRLRRFPPRGDQCQLRAPVSLVVPDAPDVTVLQVRNLPLVLGTA